MYTLYIIECADGSLYTGITTDLMRRFAEHQAGKGGHYTRAHKPVRIIYSEVHANRSQASVREAAVKKLSREEKIILVRGSKVR
jgi:putative endonuclease